MMPNDYGLAFAQGQFDRQEPPDDLFSDKSAAKTMDELGEDLCKYCPLPENLHGVHCYGGEPVFCQDYGGACEKAYQDYLDDFESEEN